MDGVLHQQRLLDLFVTGLAMLVLIVGVFVLGVVSLALPVPRQRQALNVIDCLITLAVNFRGYSANSTGVGRNARRSWPRRQAS